MIATRVPSLRALVFDLDGTLIDSQRDLIHAVNATLRELERQELPEETISSYIGHGAPLLVRRFLGPHATDAERDLALQFFLSYYENHKLDSTCAYPGAMEALEKLSGFPMAVLTNKPTRISVRILDALGMSKYFRAIYGGDSFATKKPDALGANHILSEFGVRAQDAMLVGDSEVDVQTARNSGMMSAIVNYGFGVHDRTAHPADIYVERLVELAPLLGTYASRP